MMFRADVSELWNLIDDTKSVQVVKHDYTPKTRVKYLGAMQYAYPRKNWSSVMLFNCSHSDCRALHPTSIQISDPGFLHRMNWTSDDCVGELPLEWNHLVGEYAPNPDAKICHHTIGGPWFHEYHDVEFSDEWRSVNADMTYCAQREDKDAV